MPGTHRIQNPSNRSKGFPSGMLWSTLVGTGRRRNLRPLRLPPIRPTRLPVNTSFKIYLIHHGAKPPPPNLSIFLGTISTTMQTPKRGFPGFVKRTTPYRHPTITIPATVPKPYRHRTNTLTEPVPTQGLVTNRHPTEWTPMGTRPTNDPIWANGML